MKSTIKLITIFSAIFIAFFSFFIIYNYIENNKGRIKYNGRAYNINTQVTDSKELNEIKSHFVNTDKKSNGYKIYAQKSKETETLIYSQNKKGDFYLCSLVGGP